MKRFYIILRKTSLALWRVLFIETYLEYLLLKHRMTATTMHLVKSFPKYRLCVDEYFDHEHILTLQSNQTMSRKAGLHLIKHTSAFAAIQRLSMQRLQLALQLQFWNMCIQNTDRFEWCSMLCCTINLSGSCYKKNV